MGKKIGQALKERHRILPEWAVFTVDSGRSELNRRVETSSWASAALQPSYNAIAPSTLKRTFEHWPDQLNADPLSLWMV